MLENFSKIDKQGDDYSVLESNVERPWMLYLPLLSRHILDFYTSYPVSMIYIMIYNVYVCF